MNIFSSIITRGIAVANWAVVVLMMITGYAYFFSPIEHSLMSATGVLFPVFLVLNILFLVFWVVVKFKYSYIPILGLVLCYTPTHQYVPLNIEKEAPKGSLKVLSYNIQSYGYLPGDETRDEENITPLMRANISYVPQGNTLMSGTIKENLLLGNPFATMEEMEKALTLSCAQFVFELPEGLETVVTEQGGGLSEGQAQRICIARALLRDRSIMIFDEATSALDPDTERQLLHNILENQTKTIIFITHRPAVIDYCNQSLNIIKEHEK